MIDYEKIVPKCNFIEKIDLFGDLEMATKYDGTQLADFNARHESKHYRFDIKGDEELVIENLHFTDTVTFYLKERVPSITVRNCIFEEGLSFAYHSEGKWKVNSFLIFNSVCKALAVGSNGLDFEKVSIDKCAISDLLLCAEDIDYLDFFRSDIPNICVESKLIKEIVDRGSYLGLLKIFRTDFYKIRMKTESFEQYKTSILDVSINDFIKEDLRPVKWYDREIVKTEQYEWAINYLLNFLDFIKRTNFVNSSVNYVSDVEYLYQKSRTARTSKIALVLLTMLGFFRKPWRIVMVSCIVIFLFSIGYFFITKETFSFAQSLFFSGITFFTIGYSDMTIIKDVSVIKCGGDFLKQFFIFAEAGLGMFLSSSLLVSIINKHKI